VPKVPHLTLSGAAGSLKSPRVMALARSYSARSAHLWPLGHALAKRHKIYPTGEHGQAPRLARAKRGAEKYPGVKKGR
jgi:hypothetical protein